MANYDVVKWNSRKDKILLILRGFVVTGTERKDFVGCVQKVAHANLISRPWLHSINEIVVKKTLWFPLSALGIFIDVWV